MKHLKKIMSLILTAIMVIAMCVPVMADNTTTTTYKITAKTGKVIGIKITNGEEDVMLITDTGVVIRLKVSEISILGRSTQGVTLMRTNDGGKVVSFEIVEPEEETEE